MHPCSLVAWAACAVMLTLVTPQAESATTPATPTSSPHIVKQINRVNDDGSYTIGYEAADGTFKIETRDSGGNVKGMFGFLDASGHIKRVAYATNNVTDIPHNIEDINTVPELKRSPTTKRPSLLRSTIRTRSPPRVLNYRRPAVHDTESPDDESPIFAMLLRRSRQGQPSRSDADELLRLQQQTDSSDVYGASSPSYQVPDVPFRQHFLQGGRGRINNAVLNHHLRQLTPDQLYELQQYATTASTQNVPEPTYASRVPTTYAPSTRNSAMAPLLQYLAGNTGGREVYDSMYPTRYPYSQPQAQNYYYPPTQPTYYPSQAYSGYNPLYNGLTSARSYPFQSPNLPDELRQALIFRMLLAARLLGLESFISRYNQVEDPRYFDQYYEDPRLAFSQGRTSSLYQDPSRYYPRGSPYLQQPSYQAAVAVARANHARQLAEYQQSLIAQDRQISARPTYPTQDYTDDAAITELRRQFGDPSVSPPRYQYVYRDSASSDDDYGTVTPSSSPSVSSTTPSTTSGGVTRTERPTPSYIQRVRSVQVLNAATASPRGSSSTVSPTTRRPLAA